MHDLFQRRGRPRKWVVLMYQPIASVYFLIYSYRCNFKLFIYVFYFIFILFSQTFINWSAQNTFKFAFYTNHSRLILLRQISNDNFLKAPLKSTIFKNEQREHPGGGGGLLGSGFAGYVPLDSQNPHPIIVYSVAKYRPHLSHFWANVIVISRTEFNASRMLNIKTTAGTIFQPRIFLFSNPFLPEFSYPKIPKICDPILVTLLKM